MKIITKHEMEDLFARMYKPKIPRQKNIKPMQPDTKPNTKFKESPNHEKEGV